MGTQIRWTGDQKYYDILDEELKNAPNKTAAFKNVAQKLGTNDVAVSQAYYHRKARQEEQKKQNQGSVQNTDGTASHSERKRHSNGSPVKLHESIIDTNVIDDHIKVETVKRYYVVE